MIFAAGMTGCKKDFLSQPNYDQLSQANFPQQIDQVELFVNAMYADQHSFGLYGHAYLAEGIYCLEHTSDQNWINDSYWNNLHQNNVKPGDLGEGGAYNIWRDGSYGVTQANTVLGIVSNYRANYQKAGEADELNLIEGQAYYMRAWNRMILLGVFGETFIHGGQGGDKLGIPLINSVATTVPEMQVKRSTVQASMDSIISDLKQAETLLANKTSWDAAESSKITIWGIKAMLGKAYIWDEDFADAKVKLKEVINGSGKSLMPFDTYKDMFMGLYPNNQESLIEISYKQDGQWSTWGASTANNAPMMWESAVFDPSGQMTYASWTNIFVHDANLVRFGFNEPTFTPVPNSEFDSSQPCTLSNLPILPPDNAYIQRSIADKTNGKVDPRMWVSCLEPFVDSYNAFGQMCAVAPVQQDAATIGLYHSFSLRKYTNLNGRGPDTGMNYTSQMYLMRLADVYLYYAEACAQTGDNADALEYINKVHRRAYSQPVDSPSPVDYKSLTDATNASDPILKNDPLKYERWAELFGEGGWWFDVCRWKLGSAEAAYYQKVRSGTIKWDDSRSYGQPIPTAEFEANPNMVQNEGY
jgi:starch-binding outer membrane protein, SusD/RagB family